MIRIILAFLIFCTSALAYSEQVPATLEDKICSKYSSFLLNYYGAHYQQFHEGNWLSEPHYNGRKLVDPSTHYYGCYIDPNTYNSANMNIHIDYYQYAYKNTGHYTKGDYYKKLKANIQCNISASTYQWECGYVSTINRWKFSAYARMENKYTWCNQSSPYELAICGSYKVPTEQSIILNRTKSGISEWEQEL